MECKRSVLSCARCRKRKIKCDRSIPCGQCIKAEKECTGFSSQDGNSELPRSIVQHLESEIAKIEGELARNGHLEELNASDILAGMPTQNGIPFTDHVNPIAELARAAQQEQSTVEPAGDTVLPEPEDPNRQEIMGCRELQAMMYAILAPGPGMTDLTARIKMSLTPSTTLTAMPQSPNAPRRKPVSRSRDEIGCPRLKSMPRKVIQNLMKKYMSRVYPIFPIFYAPDIYRALENVTNTLQALPPEVRSIPPSFDCLLIYLLLSISATLGSAKSGHEQKHMIFSGSLFEEGIQHFTEKAKIPSDLAGVQITLLILQYASINPHQANVWMLSGTVMRSCLELGLHREPPDTTKYSSLSLDLRRRVFWSAYCFDRSICSALQRPQTIPDETIDVRIPSTLDDRYFASSVPNTSTQIQHTKEHLVCWVQFRRLQSRMTEVHFQGAPLAPGQTWDDWLNEMEAQLRRWYDTYRNDALTDFTLMHGLMNLHRPSPRMPNPESRCLMVGFEAACTSAKSLLDHINNGFYRRSWLIAHHVLEGSMVVIYCLRHGYDVIASKFTAPQIFEMTKSFTANFLTLASQGWSEVSHYAGVYERLLAPLLESVFNSQAPSDQTFKASHEAELKRMLYPGPAQLNQLKFGSRIMQNQNASLYDFDLGDVNWDDFSIDSGQSNSMEFGSAWDMQVDPALQGDTRGMYGMS